MFNQRINKTRELIKKLRLDGTLISSVSNITYLTGYTNFSNEEREAYLIITKKDQFIITDGRYKEAVLKQTPIFHLIEISPGTPLKNIFKKISNQVKSLGVEEDELTVQEHQLLTRHFQKIKHVDFKIHRAIKTSDEIKKIESAAKLGDKTFEHIIKKIKPGITEKKLAFEIEFFIKRNGGDLSFPPIVAFGKNSSVPHHQTGETKLKNRDFVLLDFGVKFKNYCSDMTRTVFFGRFSDKQKKMYSAVLKAQKMAVEYINKNLKSGNKIYAKEVDKVARKHIESQGYPTIPHSLGHGIGLEVHEHPSLSPKSKDILKEGMVFSIEPGIYLPGFGGVRIEDSYILEKNGLRQLTNSDKKLFFV